MKAKRLTKPEKQLEAAIDAAFYKLGNRVQFNIMDLRHVSAAGRTAYTEATAAGAAHESAMEQVPIGVAAGIAKYRKN